MLLSEPFPFSNEKQYNQTMELKTRLESDLKNAMRTKDELGKRTLRLALTNIRLAEVEKGHVLDEAALIGLLQKEIKSRSESIADAERARRQDLIPDLMAEAQFLQSYLPQALSAEELESMARQAILEAGASGPAQMGAVMKILIPRLQGRASGNEASQAVRRLLGG
jgi:uncharacterized protein YqeY